MTGRDEVGRAASAPGAPRAVDVCRSPRCQAKIRWAMTDSGETIPVDYAPDPDGNLVRVMRAPGDWRIRVLPAGAAPRAPGETRWTSHLATCPEATRFRSPARRRPPEPAAARALRVVPAAVPVLLVVDGNSLAHRAYHAYERTQLRDPTGRPLWAVYGFLALLAGIIDRAGRDALLVGFDDRAASVRRDRYPGYKAGRAQRSPDLYDQLDQVVQILDELGVATVVPAGLEADDVLASAASAAVAAGWRCVLATSDKDAFALVDEQVTVLRLMSGLDNAQHVTPQALAEQYGVTPGQWRDYTALVGDKSDNLPGVAGFGPKTAVKLLAAAGSLDAALADPGAAVAAVGKAAAGRLAGDAARAVIAVNRDLMAAVTDLPVDLDGCRPRMPAADVVRVLQGRHLPGLADRVALAVGRPPRAGLVVGDAKALPSTPPSLQALAVGQDDAQRACSQCGAVCPARVPLEGDPGVGVLLAGMTLMGDVLLVPVAGGWVARRIGGYVGDSARRCREHACPVYPHRCVTPGHEGRSARLYPGGRLCDECAEVLRSRNLRARDSGR